MCHHEPSLMSFHKKSRVKFVWEIDVQHVVCGMLAFLLGLHDIVSVFYRHIKLFCRQVSSAGLALLGLLPEQPHSISAGAGFLVNCSHKIEGFYLLCSGNLWISFLGKCKHAPVCAKE